MSPHFPIFRTGIGQSSHRFLPEDSSKPCMIGGVIFEGVPGLDAESDGDVVYHALCNAITSITRVQILGQIAVELCRKDGITDSQVYLEKALETLYRNNLKDREFGKEAPQNFDSERVTIAEWQGASENQDSGVKPTPPKTDSSGCFGINDQKIIHVALTVEGKRPRLLGKIEEICSKVASVCQIHPSQVGLSVTSGDGLTDFGCGEGLQCICVLTTST